MVKNRTRDSVPRPVKQGVGDTAPEPNKIKASTPFDFQGRNLTAYGGLLPVATMLDAVELDRRIVRKNGLGIDRDF